jgi:hypothetical protein
LGPGEKKKKKRRLEIGSSFAAVNGTTIHSILQAKTPRVIFYFSDITPLWLSSKQFQISIFKTTFIYDHSYI